MASACLVIANVCLTRAPVGSGESLFGFPDFLTGLALLALVFTQSDPLYRFRIAVAPIPLGGLTLAAIILVGGASLLNDLWFALGWYSLPWAVPKVAIQAILGGFLFLAVLLWLMFAFARPPRFGRFNARKFTEAVYRGLALGGEGVSPAIALEIRRSSAAIVAACKAAEPPPPGQAPKEIPEETKYAFDLLRLIANRRFCRQLIASSPGTAMALMDEAARQEVYFAPLGGFAQNITIEAIKNHDSGLYHEDRYGISGLLGQMQPFTRAMYGCYDLVENSSTAMASAIDLHYRDTDGLTAREWEAYGRAITTTTADYLKVQRFHHSSRAINRAIEHIVNSTGTLYRIDGITEWRQWREESDKLDSAMSVIDEIVGQIDESPNRPTRRHVLTGHRKYHQRDLTDELCDALLEILTHAAAVKEPTDTAWAIHHNIFWSGLNEFTHRSETWKIIRARFTRLIIHELKNVRRYGDFKSIRIIGLLLNVLGVHENPKGERNSEFAFLRRYVIRLVKTTYMKIVTEQPHVAEACLLGGITFDAPNKRLVKTYMRGLQVEPAREYLDLDEWALPTPVAKAPGKLPPASKGGARPTSVRPIRHKSRTRRSKEN
ncbi:hypothetical protein [Caulobacter sp. UNC279MFTsu5.1]|uniref:hypothetical protein n=1 Tax=Caulobacter sp. UNC279MFTsu5.1 TaxID=1502775 RepID=UPI00036EC9DA|nr:hypothetical protein [Caulobacter sp. UNC279MFTsu5.1]SFK75146.1 hypothetical protein SAMN02799626_05072 [Caulobacter sp. UNC279MFTsu5.1]